mgnify:CR=1 FL=1
MLGQGGGSGGPRSKYGYESNVGAPGPGFEYSLGYRFYTAEDLEPFFQSDILPGDRDLARTLSQIGSRGSLWIFKPANLPAASPTVSAMPSPLTLPAASMLPGTSGTSMWTSFAFADWRGGAAAAWGTASSYVHGGLTAVSFVPAVGSFAMYADAGIYALERDYASAAINTAAATLGLGTNAGLAKAALGVGIAARAIAPSSRALGRALEAAGHVRPPGSAAHHIVAGRAERAAPARAVLDRFGIGINDAANGAFLRSGAHNGLHTNAYYETVNSALSQATTRQEALQVLDALRRGLP